jgi:hypothetical protein
MSINTNSKKAVQNSQQSHPLLPSSDDENEYSDNGFVPMSEAFIKSDNESIKTKTIEDKPSVPPRLKLKSIINQTLSGNAIASPKDDMPQKVQAQLLSQKKASSPNRYSNLSSNSVRWFYKLKDDASNPKWLPFNGWESLDIETEYQNILAQRQTSKKIQVLNSKYVVNITERTCSPIYWDGKLLTFLIDTWLLYGMVWKADKGLSFGLKDAVTALTNVLFGSWASD